MDYELIELVYGAWSAVSRDEITDMATDTYTIYKALVGNSETTVRLPASTDLRIYVTSAMLLGGCNSSREKPAIVVVPGKWQQQKALSYAQQLDSIMLDLEIIREPAKPVIHGDKEHYLCVRRYFEYRHSSIHSIGRLNTLLHSSDLNSVDLDRLHLDKHVRKRICVRDCGTNCYYRPSCSYIKLMKQMEAGLYPVQICSPYLFTKQVYDYYMNNRVFHFPDHSVALVTDSGCIDASSRELMRQTISQKSIKGMVSALLTASDGDKAFHMKLTSTCAALEKSMLIFFSTAEQRPYSQLTKRRLKKMLKNLRGLERLCW